MLVDVVDVVLEVYEEVEEPRFVVLAQFIPEIKPLTFKFVSIAQSERSSSCSTCSFRLVFRREAWEREVGSKRECRMTVTIQQWERKKSIPQVYSALKSANLM